MRRVKGSLSFLTHSSALPSQAFPTSLSYPLACFGSISCLCSPHQCTSEGLPEWLHRAGLSRVPILHSWLSDHLRGAVQGPLPTSGPFPCVCSLWAAVSPQKLAMISHPYPVGDSSPPPLFPDHLPLIYSSPLTCLSGQVAQPG